MAYGGGRKQYDNNLSGVLFANERKNGDQDPDLSGSCEIDGVEYWVAAWWNNHQQKGDYIKFKLTAKESNGGQQRGGRQPYGPGNRPSNGGGTRGGVRGAPAGNERGRDGYGTRSGQDQRGYQEPRGGNRGGGGGHPNAPGRSAEDEFDEDIPF